MRIVEQDHRTVLEASAGARTAIIRYLMVRLAKKRRFGEATKCSFNLLITLVLAIASPQSPEPISRYSNGLLQPIATLGAMIDPST
jgi:ABC-type transport system involved in cytochrome c biogenesis permease component